MISGKVDQLKVHVYEQACEMGKQAAIDFTSIVADLLLNQEKVRCVFAAAPSQNAFLQYLGEHCKVVWERVEAFHMDEYIGLGADSLSSFSYFLKDKLFSRVPVGQFHTIDPTSISTEEVCDSYTKLLAEEDIDIVVMGIGEKGHIAFNDPPLANFKDPLKVKVVELDHACRVQQVNDGAFSELDKVPTHAVTMTIPALIDTKNIICIVPGNRKADAILKTISGPVEESCPASILRTCSQAKLYLDVDSFSQCDPNSLTAESIL